MTDRKQRLEELKADLLGRLEKYEAHQHRETGALEADFAEQAVQRQNDEVVDGLEAEVRATLNQVNHALARIADGVGDQCESCGKSINPDRLAALPRSTLCIDCAE